MSVQVIDTTASVAEMVDRIVNLPVSPPSLYIDLEGIELGRYGFISIVTLYVLPTGTVYLIDVHVLGIAAFFTTGKSKQTLQSILESEQVPKVFFDVRNDSDALNCLFQVKLAGIIDLQLLELATRGGSMRFLHGLAKCISKDANLTPQQDSEWQKCKSAGRALFAPEKGGRYEVFNERPLRKEIADYSAQDVTALPKLWEAYSAKLSHGDPYWPALIETTMRKRITDSQSAWYVPDGKDKALGPWNDYDDDDDDTDSIYGSDVIVRVDKPQSARYDRDGDDEVYGSEVIFNSR